MYCHIVVSGDDVARDARVECPCIQIQKGGIENEWKYGRMTFGTCKWHMF